MFEQSMIPRGGRKPWTMAVATLGQLAVVCLLVLVPLMYVQALPAPDLMSLLVAPPPPAPPPPPPPAAAQPRATQPVITRHFDVNALTAPKVVPSQIAAIQDISPAAAPEVGVAGGVPGGVPGGQPGGVLGSVLHAVPSPAPPPPPPPPAAAVKPPAPAPAQQTIHVGGNVQEALLVTAPQPRYPILARQAHVQGTVELKAVIGANGRIQDLSVVSGNPLLVEAAIDAVKQWVYQPTILNGRAVQVATEIAVHFRLG